MTVVRRLGKGVLPKVWATDQQHQHHLGAC